MQEQRGRAADVVRMYKGVNVGAAHLAITRQTTEAEIGLAYACTASQIDAFAGPRARQTQPGWGGPFSFFWKMASFDRLDRL